MIGFQSEVNNGLICIFGKIYSAVNGDKTHTLPISLSIISILVHGHSAYGGGISASGVFNPRSFNSSSFVYYSDVNVPNISYFICGT